MLDWMDAIHVTSQSVRRKFDFTGAALHVRREVGYVHGPPLSSTWRPPVSLKASGGLVVSR